MKNSTKFLTLASVAAAIGLSAQAEASFSPSSTVLPATHRTGVYAADFSNNGYMDIFCRGQYSPEYEHPGIWSWTSQSTFAFNLGNDEWNIDYVRAEQNDEPNLDEDGNPVLDEDGNPVYNWHLVAPNHGVRAGTYDQATAIDYNNDGLLDLLVFGEDNSDDWYMPDEMKKNHLSLYKNNGDGTFSLVENAVFPTCKPQKSRLTHGIAVGDYDHDGFMDFFVTGNITGDIEDETLPTDMAYLYRNINGTGEFQQMNICKSELTTYTREFKDDEGNITVEKRALEGWFLPIRGEVYFADLNNDGWLDLVLCGEVMGESWPYGEMGYNCARVYLNREGKEFEDVTPAWDGIFYSLRNGSGTINDFDGDGYLDWFHIGWGDNGYGWNAFLYTNTAADVPFDIPSTCSDLGVDGDEEKKVFARDFDGDGNLDIVYTKKDNKITVFYGSMSGSFEKVQYDDCRTGDYGMVADFNNDGLTDLVFAGDWGDDYFCGKIYYNTTDETVDTPEAPANVSVAYADGRLTISWDEVDGAAENRQAYNLFVKNAEGQIYTIVPADIATGYVKVSDNKHVALRPDVTSYSLTVPEGEYTVGVQTISLQHETYSPFATASLSGIEGVTAEAAAGFAVEADSEGILVAGNGEEVTVADMLGRTVAKGVAGKRISTAAKGVLVVTRGNEAVKIVK